MTDDPHRAGLAPFQAEVAQVTLRATTGRFTLAGAGALIATA